MSTKKSLFIRIFSFMAILGFLIPAIPPVRAGECFVGRVQEMSGTVTIASGVFVRDNACMEQSTVLTSVPAGATIKVLGEWDGWYKVEYGTARGWLYGTFVKSVAASTGERTEYQEFESAHPSGASAVTAAPAPTPTPAPSGSLMSRVMGYILLQVQSHGEAWYVDPITGKRYYMKDGPTAYQMLRSFGLGVTESDYASIAGGNWSLKSRLAGRIILRVQAHGEAYYIHPDDLSVNYLKNGDEAYRIMREISLGITNADLNLIPSSATLPKPGSL